MTRNTLLALLLAVLPAAHAVAGTVDPSERPVMRDAPAGTGNGYALYVANRWQPITIHLDQPALGNALSAGLSGPRRVVSSGALYGWAQGSHAGSTGSIAAGNPWRWGRGRSWFEADDEGDGYPIPPWHGHGHGHGHGPGTGDGGSNEGGGVSAVPLPAAFPLLLSALALLGFALRGAGRD